MPINLSSEKSFLKALQGSLPAALPQFLSGQRWFGGKARAIDTVHVLDVIPFGVDTLRSYVVLAQVQYSTGPEETYNVPLVQVADPASKPEGSSWLKVRLDHLQEEMFFQDASKDRRFLVQLLDAIAQGALLPGLKGKIRAVSTAALPALWDRSQGMLAPSPMNAEQSNSSAVYENRVVLKIFRRVEKGLNPDLEIGSFLTEKTSFRSVAPLAGYLEHVSEAGMRTSVGVLQGYIANQGDAWQLTLSALAEYYERASGLGHLDASEIPVASVLGLAGQSLTDDAARRIGPYLDSAALLGRRTAELHTALASVPEDPDFAPKPFSEADRQIFVDSAVQLLAANLDLLRRLQDGMPSEARKEAGRVLQLEAAARGRLRLLTGMRSSAMVTRIHGDYHLGQVLFTGRDFVIVDFEGEPARPLEERRQKRSPLQDVAGMLRSFHYAAYAPLLQQDKKNTPVFEEKISLAGWAQYWQKWVSAAFLKTYLEVAENSIFIPASRDDLQLLLDLFLLNKAVYELGYELNNRPAWVRIPLDGISQLLRTPQ